MASPLIGDRRRYEPGTLGAATLRRRPSQSLVVGRLRRAIQRQWLAVVLITLILAAVGIAYDLAGGVRPAATAVYWAPLGLAVGLGFGLLRELSRNRVTSISSFGKHRGYTILGASPELTPGALRQLPPDKRTPVGCLAFQPSSAFATAFRDLQGAIGETRVLSFIGAIPNEGATTAALCTAISATQQGRRVIVLDCDLRRRSLTRALGYDVDEGVLEAAQAPESWRDYLAEEEETGLHFIPAGRLLSPWRTLTGAPGFSVLIEELSRAYDLIVLDCPPALGNAEGTVIASMAERTIVVTAWDRTPVSAVRNTMRALQRRPQLATGVYVNRVPAAYRFGRLRPD